MDYNKDDQGVNLFQYQWDLVDDPKFGLYWFMSEEEAAFEGVLSMTLQNNQFSGDNKINIATFIDQNTSIAYHGNGGVGNKIKISVKPNFMPNTDNTTKGFYTKIKIYTNNAETPHFVSQPKKVRSISGKYTTSKAFDFELSDQVGFYPDFKIEYYASLTKEGEYSNIDTFNARMYTTYREPTFGIENDNRLDERLLYFGCMNAAGAINEESLINSLWVKFEIKNNNEPYGDLYQENFNPNLEQNRIGYYTPGDIYSNWAEAVNSGSGTCAAFSDIFMNSLQLQGVEAERENYYPPDDEKILIEQWDFIANGSSENVDYPFINAIESERTEARFAPNTGEYFWANTPEVNKVVNVEGNPAGQANRNPVSDFYSHIMVNVGGKIYDPSYGVIYNDIDDFVNKAIAGYFILGQTIIGEQQHYVWYIRKSN